jgi:RNA polymerase sigma-70 factor, ECF subfamily
MQIAGAESAIAPALAGWIDATSQRQQPDNQAMGQALQSFRQYLLLIAAEEIDPKLVAKGGASDLVQETFLEAQRDFERFRGRTEPEMRAWLRQILRNNLANFRRRFREADKRRLDREVSLDRSDRLGTRLEAGGDSPSLVAIRRETEAALNAALVRLPEHYRRAILLRHQEHRSFEEIGQDLGTSPEAARMVWARAIKRLRLEIAETERPSSGGGATT